MTWTSERSLRNQAGSESVSRHDDTRSTSEPLPYRNGLLGWKFPLALVHDELFQRLRAMVALVAANVDNIVSFEALGTPPPGQIERAAVEKLAVHLGASLGNRLLVIITQVRFIMVPAVERVPACALVSMACIRPF